MDGIKWLTSRESIMEKLQSEEDRVRQTLKTDSEDIEELQSEWQERDSAAERTLREVEWNQYAALQNELSEIGAAKERLADNLYGICEDCEKDISHKRLAAVPTARKCLPCQEKIEKELGIADRKASL